MDKLEFKGSTPEDAIEIGLKELNITRDQAEIKIISDGGRLKKAVVEISKKQMESEILKKPQKDKVPKKLLETEISETRTEGERALDFIDGIAKKMNVDCSLDLKEDDEKVEIFIKGEHTGALIGYRGDVLDSIQYLASSLVNNDRNKYKRISVDCENYREKRAVILAGLARRLADKAVRTGRRVKIEPMNPSERRIIHSTLQENSEVTTLSEGVEPNRHIVITPKELKDNHFENRNFKDRKNFSDKRDRPSQSRGEEKRPAYKTGFGSFLGNTKNYDE